MTFEVRLVVVALAAFGVAATVGSFLAAIVYRTIDRRRIASASTMFQVRLIPTAVASVALILAVAAFERFEPRVDEERTGLMLLGFGALTLVLLSTTARRLWHSYRMTRQALGRWLQCAERIDLPDCPVPAYAIASPFPIVAIVGIIRPKLVIARSVLAGCSGEELDAILAHERSHLQRRDNVRRALVWAAPGLFMWHADGRRQMAQWQAAAEERADSDAARSAPGRRLHLAAALIRVARLAPAGSSPEEVPASALYRGENIELRVRRLLDPSEYTYARSQTSSWLLTSTLLLLPASLLALKTIHALVESAIAYLP